MMNWKFWDKKERTEVLINKPSYKMEDFTYVRGIHEKLASLEVGQTFALATRTGMHIFQKTGIQSHEQVKSRT